MNTPTTKSKSSQDFVPIKEIRDNVLVLKDGSYRMLLMTSALNFALKSSDEQTAIIIQYQNFLNSLDFSIQIFVQSRSLNIEPYLETLRQREKEQTNELLKIQMKEYVDFVKEFVATTSIVNKSFYIVVPYSSSSASLSATHNPISDIFAKFFPGNKAKASSVSQEKFEECKIQLQQRVGSVIQGLSRVGIRSAPLKTEEIIELFFKLYNPSEIELTKIPGST